MASTPGRSLSILPTELGITCLSEHHPASVSRTVPTFVRRPIWGPSSKGRRRPTRIKQPDQSLCGASKHLPARCSQVSLTPGNLETHSTFKVPHQPWTSPTFHSSSSSQTAFLRAQCHSPASLRNPFVLFDHYLCFPSLYSSSGLRNREETDAYNHCPSSDGFRAS